MDLLNQTVSKFSIQVSDLAIALNPDIFETNVLNITILLAGIIYLGSNALSESLAERQEKILSAIQEAENKLQNAISRLTESEKQLKQSQIVIKEIQIDAEKTAVNVKNSILEDGKAEIERLTTAAKLQIQTVETKVRKQISDYVIALALRRVTLQLENKLNSNLQQQIIDRNISKLSN